MSELTVKTSRPTHKGRVKVPERGVCPVRSPHWRQGLLNPTLTPQTSFCLSASQCGKHFLTSKCSVG